MKHEAQAKPEGERIRTITLTASISAATHCRLDTFLRQQTELWNAALEGRIAATGRPGRPSPPSTR